MLIVTSLFVVAGVEEVEPGTRQSSSDGDLNGSEEDKSMKRHGFPNPWRGGGCGRTMKRFDDPAAPQKDKTFLVGHVIAALDDSMRKTMEPLQPQ